MFDELKKVKGFKNNRFQELYNVKYLEEIKIVFKNSLQKTETSLEPK